MENIKNKNRAFQEFAQIKVTGELNDETKKKMAEPRCGVVDIRVMGSTRGKIFKTPQCRSTGYVDPQKSEKLINLPNDSSYVFV